MVEPKLVQKAGRGEITGKIWPIEMGMPLTAMLLRRKKGEKTKTVCLNSPRVRQTSTLIKE